MVNRRTACKSKPNLWAAAASDLGIGEKTPWPPFLETTLGNREPMLFQWDSHGEAEYVQETTGLHLIVYNF